MDAMCSYTTHVSDYDAYTISTGEQVKLKINERFIFVFTSYDYLGITEFLDFFHKLVSSRTRRFENYIYFLPQVKMCGRRSSDWDQIFLKDPAK
jgi:hypothetical protein